MGRCLPVFDKRLNIVEQVQKSVPRCINCRLLQDFEGPTIVHNITKRFRESGGVPVSEGQCWGSKMNACDLPGTLGSTALKIGMILYWISLRRFRNTSRNHCYEQSSPCNPLMQVKAVSCKGSLVTLTWAVSVLWAEQNPDWYLSWGLKDCKWSWTWVTTAFSLDLWVKGEVGNGPIVSQNLSVLSGFLYLGTDQCSFQDRWNMAVL